MKHKAQANPQSAERERLLRQLCHLEFLFVTGKGGVGKSTTSAILALHAGTLGLRVLVVYPGDSEPHPDLWGRPIGEEVAEVSQNVWAVSINPESSMRQYSGEVLGSNKLAAILFHHKVAKGLLTEIPGPSEWAILGKAWSYTRTGVQARARNENPYDLVIVDAPSSGDGSGLLKMPQVVVDLSPAAVLRRDAQSCLDMLRDARRSAVLFVTLAEELSVSETEENMDLVRRELRMPLGPIVINQVIPATFSAEDRARLLEIPLVPSDGREEDRPFSEEARTGRCLALGKHAALRQKVQSGYLGRVNSWGLPTIELPSYPEDLAGLGALRKLQMALAEPT